MANPALTLNDLPLAEQAKFRQRVAELGFKSPREIVSKVYDMRHSDKWRNGWVDEDPSRGLVFKRARANQIPPKFNEEFYPRIQIAERTNMAKALKVMPKHKARVVRARLLELGYSEEDFKKITWEIDAPTGDPRASGAWTVFLYLAGRGTGKTRSASEWLDEQARLSPRGSQVLVAGRTPADVDSFMLNGPGGLLTNHPDIIYIPSKRKLIWPNGVVGIIRSGANPEEFRGFSGEIAWLDEFCAWAYADASWNNLVLSLRERNPRVFISTTPRPMKILKTIMSLPKTISVVASTLENKANLSEIFIETVVNPMMTTRIGRQELSAEILDKVEGALWEFDDIEQYRYPDDKPLPDMVRVVVGVDPQGVKKDGAMTGIVVAGIDAMDHVYVIEDGSLNGKPTEWANRAISLYRTHLADKIIAEKNFGGDMVLDTISKVDKQANAAVVNASRGKIQRAEPISALYQKGMVHHYGRHSQLEDEMVSFVPGGKKIKERTDEGEVTMESPNRLDALVWAITALTEKTEPVPTKATWGRRRGFGKGGTNKSKSRRSRARVAA